jgi:Cof subfamily protein (haloacid dehalogenase superfamily)
LTTTWRPRAAPAAGEIRLLALDIDDTLIGPSGRLSPANVEAVRAARDAGVYVTLITGRRYRHSAERFARELAVDGPIGCHYGRATVMHPSGEFRRMHTLPAEVCRRVISFAAEHRLRATVCADEQLFFLDPDPSGRIYTEADRRLPSAHWVRDFESVVDENPGRVMSLTVSGTDAGCVRKLLAAEIAAGEVSVYHQWLVGRQQSLALVLAGRENKGAALRDICDLLGVSPEAAVAMGDSEADVPMLQAARYGIAMPWADPDIIAGADAVAGGEPDDAVAFEIGRLLLGRA